MDPKEKYFWILIMWENWVMLIRNKEEHDGFMDNLPGVMDKSLKTKKSNISINAHITFLKNSFQQLTHNTKAASYPQAPHVAATFCS